MRVEKGDITYKDLGYSKYMDKRISPYKPLDIETIRHMLQVGSLTDLITLTKLRLGAGVDSTDALKVTDKEGNQVFNVDTLNGWVNIGEQQPHNNMDPNIGLYLTRTTDSYYGINFQNRSPGTLASTDFIMFNDLLDLDTDDYWELPEFGWLDMGVTSSTYADPDYALMGPNTEYIWVADDFYIGSVNPDKKIYFFAGPLDDTNSAVADINGKGDISAYGMLRQGRTWHAYGGFQNENESVVLSAVNQWADITNADGDLWLGLEGDGLTLVSDSMIITNSGDYTGAMSITIAGLNGKDYEIRVYNVTKAEQMGYVIGASTTGVTNFTNITLPLYLECDAGDELVTQIRCTTDNSSPILKSAVFYISYLHDSGETLSVSPSASPSVSISQSPSSSPSVSPPESLSPSVSKSRSPSASPSVSASVSPPNSASPSVSPSVSQSSSPSRSPSISPSASHSRSPSRSPSVSPSVSPPA